MAEERIIVESEASHMPLKYTDIEELCDKAFTRNWVSDFRSTISPKEAAMA
jgi:hypothetical protein